MIRKNDNCISVRPAPFKSLLMGTLAVLFVVGSLSAQQQQNDQTTGVTPDQGEEHSHEENSHAGMVDMNSASMFLMNLASGTAGNPASWPMPMLMMHFGNWNTMLMANGFMVDTQQSGPRGGDKLYSPNWLMATTEHRVGSSGAFEAELMLSLEPATITDRRYPLLFQTGETAYGVPLVDAQHPHNFIMGLGFHYTRELGEDTVLDVYFAPVGDPALGPVAYPHRASAMELPEATLSHHLQDSTHISDDVLTAGNLVQENQARSQRFLWLRTGREPLDNRSRPNQFLVHASVVLSQRRTGRRRFRLAESPIPRRSSRGPGPHDGVVTLHKADVGGELVVELDLGPHSQYRNSAQSEFLPGGVRPADSTRQLPHRPIRAG